jgi:hypothetical protein
LQNLAAVGEYPALCRKVALINGVNNGTLNSNQGPGNTLVRINVKRRGLLWRFCGDDICSKLDWLCRTTPNYGTAKVADMWTIEPLFNVLLNVPVGRKNYYADAAWGNSAQDNAPGSLIGPIFGEAQAGQIIESKLTFLVKEFMYLLTGSTQTTFYQHLNNYTFVPSYSAADLRFANKNLYMNWSNQNLCGNTPFDFIYSASTNEEHAYVSQSSSEWFENEIKCNVADLPILFNPAISGPDEVCNFETYSVTFCKPTNATVFWAVDNTNIATVDQTGKVTRTGNGRIDLSATFSFLCGGAFTVHKVIQIGTANADFSLYPFYPNQQFCTNSFGNTIKVEPQNLPEVTGFQWGYSSYENGIPPTIINNQGTVYQDFIFSVGGNYQIFANELGSCGIGGSVHTLDIFVDDNCNGGGFNSFSVAPNPATSDVQIASRDKKTSIKEIRITDKAGNIKKAIIYSKDVISTKINISFLPPDIYYIQIFDGKKWNSKTIRKS